MQALLEVVIPIFLVIAFGYVAGRTKLIGDTAIDGLMTFSQTFAIPCLLFAAISTLDLSRTFQPALIFSYYTGALSGFGIGLIGARLLFGRPWTDSVAIGFCCMFSNSAMLALPITERAYGTEALAGNFAIVAVHSPFCYLVGVTVMEMVRGGGGNALKALGRVLRALVRNPLVLSIVLGLIANFIGFTAPAVLADALGLMTKAALPTALFALGGVLYRYKPEGDMKTILFICLVSLVIHPSITYALGLATGLDAPSMRSAVVTAAVAPGINTYLFANMYGVARRVAASAVLFATALTVVTAWAWLLVLP